MSGQVFTPESLATSIARTVERPSMVVILRIKRPANIFRPETMLDPEDLDAAQTLMMLSQARPAQDPSQIGARIQNAMNGEAKRMAAQKAENGTVSTLNDSNRQGILRTIRKAGYGQALNTNNWLSSQTNMAQLLNATDNAHSVEYGLSPEEILDFVEGVLAGRICGDVEDVPREEPAIRTNAELKGLEKDVEAPGASKAPAISEFTGNTAAPKRSKKRAAEAEGVNEIDANEGQRRSARKQVKKNLDRFG